MIEVIQEIIGIVDGVWGNEEDPGIHHEASFNAGWRGACDRIVLELEALLDEDE